MVKHSNTIKTFQPLHTVHKLHILYQTLTDMQAFVATHDKNDPPDVLVSNMFTSLCLNLVCSNTIPFKQASCNQCRSTCTLFVFQMYAGQSEMSATSLLCNQSSAWSERKPGKTRGSTALSCCRNWAIALLRGGDRLVWSNGGRWRW
jgi:hypothetical protein